MGKDPADWLGLVRINGDIEAYDIWQDIFFSSHEEHIGEKKQPIPKEIRAAVNHFSEDGTNETYFEVGLSEEDIDPTQIIIREPGEFFLDQDSESPIEVGIERHYNPLTKSGEYVARYFVFLKDIDEKPFCYNFRTRRFNFEMTKYGTTFEEFGESKKGAPIRVRSFRNRTRDPDMVFLRLEKRVLEEIAAVA